MNGVSHALVHVGPMHAVSVVMHGMGLHCNRAGVWAVATACHWQRIYVASTTWCASGRVQHSIQAHTEFSPQLDGSHTLLGMISDTWQCTATAVSQKLIHARHLLVRTSALGCCSGASVCPATELWAASHPPGEYIPFQCLVQGTYRSSRCVVDAMV